ncbi:MAG: hypothetical protein Q4F72_09935 [Desulfovibrionaceae bacterium]|nr:hypothetical protein [Desulfovibrionaceae bacterium]
MGHAAVQKLVMLLALLLICLVQTGCSAKNDAPTDYTSRPDWFPLRPDYREAAQEVFEAAFPSNEEDSFRIYVDPLEPEPYVTVRNYFKWRGMAAVEQTMIRPRKRRQIYKRVCYYYLSQNGVTLGEDQLQTTVGKDLLALVTLNTASDINEDLEMKSDLYEKIRRRAIEEELNPGMSWTRDEIEDMRP